MGLTLSDIGAAVLNTQYAVRGPIVARAQELERSGRKVIYCNIGNPQALGQKPLTWIRQGLSLCEFPELFSSAREHFPADVLERAQAFLTASRHGLGQYSESNGLRCVREAVAAFIDRRDSNNNPDDVLQKADPNSIYMTDGASKGVQNALRILISSEYDGIMIPIPQYPLYSATITLYGGRQVGYYLDEKKNWGLSEKMLEDALHKALAKGTRVRAICVINPGNPTGAVLSHSNIVKVLRFAKRYGLALLADEVYQDNIYRPDAKFISIARVMAELDERDVSLFSFHSCSKGLAGECGQRGGYMEIRNIHADVVAQITKLQSVNLCANLPGQLTFYMACNPPEKASPSYELYTKERAAVLETLRFRAAYLSKGLSEIPGISCAPIAGAMYAFPRITLPEGRTDEEYCMALLEATGICVIPGSGFGQEPGTAHFRTTILPTTDELKTVVRDIASFHATWR